MAQWELTLYQNTLSSKSGNVVPCCPTIEAKEAFRNSLQVTVPPQNLAIIDQNKFFNTDTQRLTVEINVFDNLTYQRSNYAVIKINIPDGAMYYYYWIDNIQYISNADKTGNLPPERAIIAVLELSKDIWQSEFFREEHRAGQGWVLAMPKISNPFLKRTNHTALLMQLKNKLTPNFDFSLLKNEERIYPFGEYHRVIYIYALTITGSQTPYSTYIVSYGASFLFSTPGAKNAMLNEILICNNAGEVTPGTLTVPPSYGDVRIWTSIKPIAAYIIPTDLLPIEFFGGAPNTYSMEVTFKIGTQSYKKTLGIGLRELNINRTVDIPTENNFRKTPYPLYIGTENSRIEITSTVIPAASFARFGESLLNIQQCNEKTQSPTVRLSIMGDNLTILIRTESGAEYNIANDLAVSYSYTDEGQKALERANNAELNAILGLLTNAVTLGATVATGGAAAPLLVASATTTTAHAVTTFSEIEQQKNAAARAPSIKGAKTGQLFSAFGSIYISRYSPVDNEISQTASDFTNNGSLVDCGLFTNENVPSVLSLFTAQAQYSNYHFVSLICSITGIAADYATRCQQELANGITFIYF